MTPDDLRLSQLTEVTGLSPELIRAWERRYGFPAPIRTSGGHRRYSREQAESLHRAALLIRSGFRAREAITRAQQAEERDLPSELAVEQSAEALAGSLIAGNPARALSLLRATEHALGFERALEERVLPALRSIGKGWESGKLSVAQEHTA
ncbi:MAG: MerR family transcriptional regulator, partial [Candidatus Dormibacteraeota bacterium]|nr:MerR family transcriptional regulator [Candidatus Dormibacteraeota bacterium]